MGQEDFDRHFNRGLDAGGSGKMTEAIEAFSKALAAAVTVRQKALSLVNRGITYLNLDSIDQAVADADEAERRGLPTADNRAWYAYLRSGIAWKQKDYASCEEWARKAISALDAEGGFHLQLAQALLAQAAAGSAAPRPQTGAAAESSKLAEAASRLKRAVRCGLDPRASASVLRCIVDHELDMPLLAAELIERVGLDLENGATFGRWLNAIRPPARKVRNRLDKIEMGQIENLPEEEAEALRAAMPHHFGGSIETSSRIDDLDAAHPEDERPMIHYYTAVSRRACLEPGWEDDLTYAAGVAERCMAGKLNNGSVRAGDERFYAGMTFLEAGRYDDAAEAFKKCGEEDLAAVYMRILCAKHGSTLELQCLKRALEIEQERRGNEGQPGFLIKTGFDEKADDVWRFLRYMEISDATFAALEILNDLHIQSTGDDAEGIESRELTDLEGQVLKLAEPLLADEGQGGPEDKKVYRAGIVAYDRLAEETEKLKAARTDANLARCREIIGSDPVSRDWFTNSVTLRTGRVDASFDPFGELSEKIREEACRNHRDALQHWILWFLLKERLDPRQAVLLGYYLDFKLSLEYRQRGELWQTVTLALLAGVLAYPGGVLASSATLFGVISPAFAKRVWNEIRHRDPDKMEMPSIEEFERQFAKYSRETGGEPKAAQNTA